MPATKQGLIRRLAIETGLTESEVESVVDALPNTLGVWLREDGAAGSGVFGGEIDGGLNANLIREELPMPARGQWRLTFTPNGDFLDEVGDNGARFGLPVVM